MAYNLPPPWDSGYALPDNVRDEGLERRGLVTKQLPRGTYDQPEVGTGGYVVPQYVMDEGYGQGTFTTKWAPRGTRQRVPHWLNQRPVVLTDQRRAGGGRAITVAAPVGVMTYGNGSAVSMGSDAPLPQPFNDYGARAAATIIARVAQLPSGQRTAALKEILRRIDRSLWDRSASIARELVAGGMPPGPAFRQALSRALSAGLAAEVIRAGQTSAAPQPASLLGLGCARGRTAALGATDPGAFTVAANLVICPGYSWNPNPGFWSRTAAGAKDTAGPAGGCPVAVVHLGGAVGKVAAPPPPGQMLTVGPFSFPADVTRTWSAGGETTTQTTANGQTVIVPVGSGPSIGGHADIVVHDPSIIPTAWRAWLQTYLTQAVDADGRKDSMLADYLHEYKVEADATPWFEAIGIARGVPVRSHAIRALHSLAAPMAKLKHPTTGENLALRVMLDRVDRSKAWDANSNPLVMKVWLSKVPDPSFLGRVWSAIVTVIGTIRDGVVAAVEAVADLACQMIQSPNAVAAGAVAGGGAGAAGAAIVQQTMCKKDPPPPPPPPPGSSSSNLLPLAILGGGALLAVTLLSGKKKGTKP